MAPHAVDCAAMCMCPNAHCHTCLPQTGNLRLCQLARSHDITSSKAFRQTAATNRLTHIQAASVHCNNCPQVMDAVVRHAVVRGTPATGRHMCIYIVVRPHYRMQPVRTDRGHEVGRTSPAACGKLCAHAPSYVTRGIQVTI